MVFDPAKFRGMYSRFAKHLAVKVTLRENIGSGFIDHPDIEAFRSKYDESELIANGPIQQGDIKLIMLADALPASLNRPLERKDRIQIGAVNYTVVHWDANTRAMGNEVIAIEVQVRG